MPLPRLPRMILQGGLVRTLEPAVPTQRALAILEADFEPTTRQAYWQFVVCERPAAEVAAELGITVNAVYLAKVRVLRRLREELSGLLS